jgi:hypothetical protein
MASLYVKLNGSSTGATVLTATGSSGVANTIPLTQFSSGTITLTSGQLAPLQSDRNGNIAVHEQYGPVYEDNANGVAATVLAPLANSTYSLSQFFSPQFTTGSIKTSAGNVYGFVVNNNQAQGNYFCFVNKATAGAAADIPVLVKFMPSSSSLSEQLLYGFSCATGIGFAWSTQPNVVALPSSSTGLSANVFYK